MGAEVVSIKRANSSRAVTPEQESLASALKAAALSPLEDLVASMFAQADDLIFDLAGKTSADEARQKMFDAMRSIRLGERGIREAFIGAVLRSFSPEDERRPLTIEDFDLSTLALQDADSLEIKIAVDNMAAKGRSRHLDALRDYELCLQAALRTGLLWIDDKALSPEAICEAFRDAFAGVEAGMEVKLVMFKMFERVVVAGLGDIYAAAVAILQPVTKGVPRAKAKPKIDAAAATGLEAQAEALFERSRGMIQGQGQGAAPASPQSIAELQSAIGHFFRRNGPDAMAAAEERLIAAQSLMAKRLSAVRSGSAEHAAIERLRLAVCIAALDEDGPLTDANRLARVARILGVDGAPPAAAEAASAAAPRAAAAGSAPAETEPPDAAALRQRERDRVIKTIRAEVAREVNGIIRGRVLSLPSVRFVESKLSLLLSIHRLRGGGDSPAAIAASDLVARVIDCLAEHQALVPIDDARRARLGQDLDFAYRDMGMDGATAGLQVCAFLALVEDAARPETASARGIRAGDSPDPQASLGALRKPESAPSDEDRLAACLPAILRPGIWFRIYDALSGQTRWMELENYHVAQGMVTFTGFTGSEQLAISVHRLVDDLIQGRSETTSSTPETMDALASLRQIAGSKPARRH